MKDHYYLNEQPLVVEGTTIAYALLGAQEAYKKAGSMEQRQVHANSMKRFQELLKTFEAVR